MPRCILPRHAGFDGSGESMSGVPTQGCSFCGKTEDEVQKLERGTAACICNECLARIIHEAPSDDHGSGS